MEPEDLTVIGHTGDLLVDIYARNLTHIYILPQCSTTAARVLNPAGMDAQFERLRCAISCGILNITHTIKTPEDIAELKAQLNGIVENQRGEFMVTSVEKKSFFNKIRSIFSGKRK